MTQSLTNVNTNLVFSDEKSKVTTDNLNNGDVVFCSEDNNITIKYNDELHTMGGSGVADASDSTKGITKLSDALDSDDNTVATTSKAAKILYDKSSNLNTRSSEIYTFSNQLSYRISLLENNTVYKHRKIIGVACTGEYTEDDGAKLAWIDHEFNEVTKLEYQVGSMRFNYFGEDGHPSYQFEETIIGNDTMIKIPIAYWWRGTIPRGPFQGKWGMMLSPFPDPGIEGLTFKPNYVAFMDHGTLKDCFYYSKYEPRNIDGVPISQSSGDVYTDINLIDARTKAANKGSGWHMATMQEYHEILARAVIERKTFDAMPPGSYHNIMQLGGARYYEWMDGLQVPAGTNQYWQVYDNNGDRTWVNTDMIEGPSKEYGSNFRSDQYFDNLFIHKDNGTIGVDAITPDRQFIISSRSSNTTALYTPRLYSSQSYCGAFSCYWQIVTNTSNNITFRLAKI